MGPDKKVQAICLGIAAVSLVALSQIGYESLTLVPMIGLGIAWASMVGLPSMWCRPPSRRSKPASTSAS